MPNTVRIKEFDAAREVEMQVKGDIVYIDSARSCYAFDRALFLRAVERAFDVVICDLAELGVARGDGLKDLSAFPQA